MELELGLEAPMAMAACGEKAPTVDRENAKKKKNLKSIAGVVVVVAVPRDPNHDMLTVAVAVAVASTN